MKIKSNLTNIEKIQSEGFDPTTIMVLTQPKAAKIVVTESNYVSQFEQLITL